MCFKVATALSVIAFDEAHEEGEEEEAEEFKEHGGYVFGWC